MPILTGTLRGGRWTAGVASHSCWLGTYERDTQRRLRRLLSPGGTAYDIGANAGFFTLFASQCVGPEGTVVAFEPNPTNLGALRRHLALNSTQNVTVIEAAVADVDGVAEFAIERSAEQGHLASVAEHAEHLVRVTTVALDSLVGSGAIPPPSAMKIDVEGAELLVLDGAAGIFKEYRPAVLLELHNPKMDRLCSQYLRDSGYVLQPHETWPGTDIPRGGVVAIHPKGPTPN